MHVHGNLCPSQMTRNFIDHQVRWCQTKYIGDIWPPRIVLGNKKVILCNRILGRWERSHLKQILDLAFVGTATVNVGKSVETTVWENKKLADGKLIVDETIISWMLTNVFKIRYTWHSQRFLETLNICTRIINKSDNKIAIYSGSILLLEILYVK